MPYLRDDDLVQSMWLDIWLEPLKPLIKCCNLFNLHGRWVHMCPSELTFHVNVCQLSYWSKIDNRDHPHSLLIVCSDLMIRLVSDSNDFEWIVLIECFVNALYTWFHKRLTIGAYNKLKYDKWLTKASYLNLF